ncbi:hypothetical protein Tco_1316699 [Tanacetum coccineum]
MTYPEEFKETLGTLVEEEPLDYTKLEDVGLDTCNHGIPLSSREVPSFDEQEPQPQPLPNCPSLDVSLGDERGLKPPIKPHSSDIFRRNIVDNLTIHTTTSPHMTSFYPKDVSWRWRQEFFLTASPTDEVSFYALFQAFGGNTRDLGSIGEETDNTTTLHQSLLKNFVQCLETAAQSIMTASYRWRQDFQDSVRM